MQLILCISRHTKNSGYYSVDWTTGLKYWTHIFLVFTHSVVTFGMSLLTKCLHGPSTHY